MALLVCLVVQFGCGQQESAIRTEDAAKESVKQKTIEKVLAAHTPEWMAIPGVIGTGIGEFNGKPCIKVLVVQASDLLSQRIPKDAEGYPVRIEVSGEIRTH
jgi:hypothetical protein